MDEPTDFSGQTAIITGATGGVGGAIASRLIDAGATVILLGRSRAALDRFVAERGWSPSRVRCRAVDLGDEADAMNVANELAVAHPELSFLVHSAGAIALGELEASRPDDFDLQYRINVRAPYVLTRALVSALRAGRGQIVFVNSSAGVHANRGGSQYAATKHALRAVADSLRQEVNESGVRVLSVYLGRTASRMQAAVHAHEGRPYRPELLLQPDDVAAMVMEALKLPRTAEVTDLHIRPMRKA